MLKKLCLVILVYENPCTGIDILSIDQATVNGSLALHISTDELIRYFDDIKISIPAH